MLMPEINGPALAKRLTAARPGMKVLYTSGYPDEAIVEQFGLDKECALLEKPFTRDALAKRVRGVLDAPAAQLGAASG
jgi:DNA-binding NtrC family response regulator